MNIKDYGDYSISKHQTTRFLRSCLIIRKVILGSDSHPKWVKTSSKFGHCHFLLIFLILECPDFFICYSPHSPLCSHQISARSDNFAFSKKFQILKWCSKKWQWPTLEAILTHFGSESDPSITLRIVRHNLRNLPTDGQP